MNIHVYLEVTCVSKCFLADITFVQLFFMQSFDMFLQLVLVASCSSKKHELVENVRLNFNRRVELKQLRQTDRDTGHRNGDWMDQEKVEADRIRWRME